MKDAPIGIFDSGLGGISVLNKMVKLMPEESYIYYGDSANAPYGSKSAEEVLNFSTAIFDKLISEKVKAVVIACNTATSAAASELRGKYPNIPIIGMEPAIRPAAMDHPSGTIVVMATEMTLKRKKFIKLMNNYNKDTIFVPIPCPDLVLLVESGKADTEETEIYLRNKFKELGNRKIDGIVLGCTHFPFAKSAIKRAIGYEVDFYDGREGTVRELSRRLLEKNLRLDKNCKGTVKILNSAGSEKIKLSKKLFQCNE